MEIRQIKLKTTLCGPDLSAGAGALLAVPARISAEQARQLVEQGYAEVTQQAAVQTPAIVPPADTPMETATIVPPGATVGFPQRARRQRRGA